MMPNTSWNKNNIPSANILQTQNQRNQTPKLNDPGRNRTMFSHAKGIKVLFFTFWLQQLFSIHFVLLLFSNRKLENNPSFLSWIVQLLLLSETPQETPQTSVFLAFPVTVRLCRPVNSVITFLPVKHKPVNLAWWTTSRYNNHLERPCVEDCSVFKD